MRKKWIITTLLKVVEVTLPTVLHFVLELKNWACMVLTTYSNNDTKGFGSFDEIQLLLFY